MNEKWIRLYQFSKEFLYWKMFVLSFVKVNKYLLKTRKILLTGIPSKIIINIKTNEGKEQEICFLLYSWIITFFLFFSLFFIIFIFQNYASILMYELLYKAHLILLVWQSSFVAITAWFHLSQWRNQRCTIFWPPEI